MGDSVNLGARLEGLTKEYGIKFMISEFTRAKLTRPDLHVATSRYSRQGQARAGQGLRSHPSRPPASESVIRNLIGEFEQGRAAYRKQDWTVAKKRFITCLTIRPNDGPAGV